MADQLNVTNTSVVIVTGASRGIGHAIVMDQLKRGRHVVAVVRNAGSLASLLESNSDENLHVEIADAANPEELASVGSRVQAKFGRLDSVIACAGIHGTEGSFESLNNDAWEEAFRVNVFAPAQLVRGCIQHLANNPFGGRVIFIGSNASVRSPKNFAIYNATKAAVHSITRTLSRELDGRNIAVNELRPGPTNTSLLGGGENSLANKMLGKISNVFGREWIKDASDVANAANFFIELPPHGTTGQTLTLNRYE